MSEGAYLIPVEWMEALEAKRDAELGALLTPAGLAMLEQAEADLERRVLFGPGLPWYRHRCLECATPWGGTTRDDTCPYCGSSDVVRRVC